MNDSDQLVEDGYGWKRVKVRCTSTESCGWQGRRIWRKKIFDKPCLWCKHISKRGSTTVFCPPSMATQ